MSAEAKQLRLAADDSITTEAVLKAIQDHKAGVALRSRLENQDIENSLTTEAEVEESAKVFALGSCGRLDSSKSVVTKPPSRRRKPVPEDNSAPLAAAVPRIAEAASSTNGAETCVSLPSEDGGATCFEAAELTPKRKRAAAIDCSEILENSESHRQKRRRMRDSIEKRHVDETTAAVFQSKLAIADIAEKMSCMEEVQRMTEELFEFNLESLISNDVQFRFNGRSCLLNRRSFNESKKVLDAEAVVSDEVPNYLYIICFWKQTEELGPQDAVDSDGFDHRAPTGATLSGSEEEAAEVFNDLISTHIFKAVVAQLDHPAGGAQNSCWATKIFREIADWCDHQPSDISEMAAMCAEQWSDVAKSMIYLLDVHATELHDEYRTFADLVKCPTSCEIPAGGMRDFLAHVRESAFCKVAFATVLKYSTSHGNMAKQISEATEGLNIATDLDSLIACASRALDNLKGWKNGSRPNTINEIVKLIRDVATRSCDDRKEMVSGALKAAKEGTGGSFSSLKELIALKDFLEKVLEIQLEPIVPKWKKTLHDAESAIPKLQEQSLAQELTPYLEQLRGESFYDQEQAAGISAKLDSHLQKIDSSIPAVDQHEAAWRVAMEVVSSFPGLGEIDNANDDKQHVADTVVPMARKLTQVMDDKSRVKMNNLLNNIEAVADGWRILKQYSKLAVDELDRWKKDLKCSLLLALKKHAKEMIEVEFDLVNGAERLHSDATEIIERDGPKHYELAVNSLADMLIAPYEEGAEETLAFALKGNSKEDEVWHASLDSNADAKAAHTLFHAKIEGFTPQGLSVASRKFSDEVLTVARLKGALDIPDDKDLGFFPILEICRRGECTVLEGEVLALAMGLTQKGKRKVEVGKKEKLLKAGFFDDSAHSLHDRYLHPCIQELLKRVAINQKP